MTEANQTGANWVAGGEIKALHRIIKPVLDEDDASDDLAGLGHNRPPVERQRSTSPEAAAVEAQAAAAERALDIADEATSRAVGASIQAGKELLTLRRLWETMRATELQERQNQIVIMDAEGLSQGEIATRFATSPTSVRAALARAKRGEPPPPRGRGASFAKWAASRFGRTEHAIYHYLNAARHPEAIAKKRQAEHRDQSSRFGRLLTQADKGHVRLNTFKRAFMVLDPLEREGIFRWIASVLNRDVPVA